MIDITAEQDVLADVLNLLNDSWTPGSTDDLIPRFIKITDMKKIEFNESSDWVIAQRPISEIEPSGIGDVDKHEFENFNLDVRVLGKTQESHWLNIIREIKKILKRKKVNPLPNIYSETHVLEFNGIENDLSDKTHQLWRKIVPVQFKRYKVIR